MKKEYHPDDLSGKYNQDVLPFYVQRITDNPREPWAHWLRVQLLITQGRMLDAQQAITIAAENLLWNLDTINTFYFPVMRLLLFRAQIEETEDLLLAIPIEFRDKTYFALDRLCWGFAQARRERAVLPIEYLAKGWWSQGPFLLDTENLKIWAALRISHVEGDEHPIVGNFPQKVTLYVHGAKVTPKQEQEPDNYFYSEMTLDTLKKITSDSISDLEEGRFLELGLYEDGSEKVKIYPIKGWQDPDLPILDLNTDRYLKNLF